MAKKSNTNREKLMREARAEIAARLEEPANAPTGAAAAEGEPAATGPAGTPVPPTSGTTGGKGKGKKRGTETKPGGGTPAVAVAPAKGKKGGKAEAKARQEPKANKPKRPGCLDAAATVLAAAKGPMNCRDIVDAALKRGLWETSGKTPHSTLYAAVIRDIAAKGKASRFRKVSRGEFAAA